MSTKTSTRDVAASVRARLQNVAKAQGVDFQRVLTRYALERLLYRLSVSAHKDHFLLKGALLFDLWFDVPLRPTRDMDLLGFGLAEMPHLVAAFQDICAIPVDDGIVFEARTIVADETRKEANYAGIRLSLMSILAGARCPVQIDVGYGDAVTPAPEMAEYPVLLRDSPLDKRTLSQAIAATMQRRGTVKPQDFPIGLSEQFASDQQKQNQWAAFTRRNQLDAPSLGEVVTFLREELWH